MATIFLTGASGFVGQSVLQHLLAGGHSVHALVRHPQEPSPQLRPFQGELSDAAVLDRALSGCEAAIHLVGIISEAGGQTFEQVHLRGTQSVLEAMKSAGIRRYIHMSALGTRADAATEYHRTKWQAEQAVRHSGLNWTIFRPSMIHGPDGAFMRQEYLWARGKAAPWVAMPYFAKGILGLGGSGLLQPVYVQDVAKAFALALDRPKSIGKCYDLVGTQRFTWPRMHQAISRLLVGHQRRTLPIPAWWARLMAATLPEKWLGFNSGQVTMSQEDNIGDASTLQADFGFTPGGLEQTLALYSAQMRGRDQASQQPRKK